MALDYIISAAASALEDSHAKSGERDRVVKVMDSKSIGLCPQGFESPRCRQVRAAVTRVALPGPENQRVA